MNKPQYYDEAQAMDADFIPLAPGGYVCKIIKAVCQKAEKSNNDMLVLLLDIVEGERAGYFQDRFDRDTRKDKKWGCVLRIVLDDPTKDEETRKKMAGRVKGAINSIEASNDGFKFDWNEETLKDKLVGGEFRIEEYIAQDGSTKTSTKISRLRSIESVKKGIPVPSVKLSDGTFMDYDEYLEIAEERKSNDSADKGEFITIDNTDDLPF